MTKKVFKLGISTCPNDTFIFDAIINNKIEQPTLNFEVVYADIKELNKMAFNEELDVVKVSFHTFAYLSRQYQILKSGNALGNNCGPLLVSKKKFEIDDISDLNIAIPGAYTSANLFLKLFAPEARSVHEMIFSDIEDAVVNEKVDCGLIIHESRFTYQEKGLVKIADLGELWEQSSHLPVPLGGIIAKRKLGQEVLEEISSLIKKSIEFAFNNPISSRKFVKAKAQEIDDEVIQQHIDTYVNSESIELSLKGKEAIEYMLKKAQQTGTIPEIINPIFV